jgi:hypothetical protein
MGNNADQTPRAKCPTCTRPIGVKGGQLREHGKAYGKRDYTTCPGSGTTAPMFSELTITEADILQAKMLSAIYANDGDMRRELKGMRRAVIREGYMHTG